MDDAEAIELIDAHLDRLPLTDEQSDELTAWIKADPKHADVAFYRIFLHSYLRMRFQAGLPAEVSDVLIHQAPDAPVMAGSRAALPVKDLLSPPSERKSIRRVYPQILIAACLVMGCLIAMSWWSIGFFNLSIPPDKLYVYEGFDYPATAFPDTETEGVTEFKWPTSGGLQGLNQGLGWSQPWQETNSKVAIIVDYSRQEIPWLEKDMRKFGPLGYTDFRGNVLQSSGNQMRTATTPRSITTREFDLRAFPDSMRDENGLGRDGSVIWFSFLAQSSLSTADNNRYSYLAIGSKETAGLRVGKLGAAPSGNWTATALQTGAEVNLRSSTFPSGEMVFFVVRIVFRPGPEDATVWVNPLLSTEPSVKDAAMRLPVPDFRFNGIAIHANHSSDFDELRFGGTFQSVTPVVD